MAERSSGHDCEIVDSQVHAWASEDVQPWYIDYPDEELNRKTREHFSHEIYPWERVLAEMDEAGVDAALIFNPAIYAGDVAYAMSAVNACDGRFAIVNPLTPNIDDVEGTVGEWAANPAILGVRLSAYDDASFDALVNGPRQAALYALGAREGLVVNLFAPDYAARYGEIARQFDETQFVLDHLGLRQPPVLKPLDPNDPFRGLDDILELAKLDNVAVKASSIPSVSRSSFPYRDIWSPLERVLEAFGVERVLWGSDFTRVAEDMTYREGADWVFQWEALSPHERAMLLGGSLRAIYRWPRSTPVA